MYRQGDVLVTPISRDLLPAGLVPAARDARGRMVLARGEATGHAHVVTGDRVALLCPPGAPQSLYLLVDGHARLAHDEHGPIPVPAGAYLVIRQREYVPGSFRMIAD
jgi:hypothetical protein